MSRSTPDETCRVVYASVCPKCESVISETVLEKTYEDIEKVHKSEGNKDFYVYHDKKHKALFRALTYEETCRGC